MKLSLVTLFVVTIMMCLPLGAMAEPVMDQGTITCGVSWTHSPGTISVHADGVCFQKDKQMATDCTAAVQWLMSEPYIDQPVMIDQAALRCPWLYDLGPNGQWIKLATDAALAVQGL